MELRKLLFFPLFYFASTNSTENISLHSRSNSSRAIRKTGPDTEFISATVERRENNHKKYYEFLEKEPSDWRKKKWKRE